MNTKSDKKLTPEEKFAAVREQCKREAYEHLVATGFFTGTYKEYKELTKHGAIGPVGPR